MVKLFFLIIFSVIIVKAVLEQLAIIGPIVNGVCPIVYIYIYIYIY